MTQLALVIDLNVCVGCHACVTSCKEWNTSGQAGWYDVRVRIYPAQEAGVSPQFETLPAAPGTRKAPSKWMAYVTGKEIGE